jgi:uncharacterized protein YgiB involved in biofilm formation
MEEAMNFWTAAVLAAGLMAAPAVFAAEKDKKDDPKHVKEGIADHRAMAEAHFNAAKCLESGRPEKECHAQLAKDCKGLGIGKYCGMKHKH